MNDKEDHFLVIIVIFCLSLLCFSVFPADVFSANSFAIETPDQEETRSILLDESRFWQDAEKVAENVIIVTEEKIKSLPANNVAEVLFHIPGFNIDLRRTKSEAMSS